VVIGARMIHQMIEKAAFASMPILRPARHQDVHL
jgi:hypothetical protein